MAVEFVGSANVGVDGFGLVFASSQCQVPLCSICQNQVTPRSVFSTIPMGR